MKTIHPDRQAYYKSHYAANKEESKAKSRAYYLVHKEEISAKKKLRRDTQLEECRTSERAYYANNKDKAKAKQIKYKEKRPEAYKLCPSYGKICESRRTKEKQRRNLLDEVKLHYGCVNPGCKWVGLYTSAMLDFHHVNYREKFKCVSQIRTLKPLCAEINKCCVMCANCHREETYGNLDASSFKKCRLSEDGKFVAEGVNTA